jgi:hypothetical protein
MRMDAVGARRDANGWTPLRFSGWSCDAVRLLLSATLPPDHRTSEDEAAQRSTTLPKYQGRNHVSSICFRPEAILCPGSENQVNLVTQFHTAVQEGQRTSDLLTNKELVPDTDRNGWTALQVRGRCWPS